MFSLPVEARLLSLVEQSTKAGLSPSNLVDPATNKMVNIPTILSLMKDYINKNEGKYANLTNPFGKLNINPLMMMGLKGGGGKDVFFPPLYKPDVEPSSFQQQVQQFIRNIPAEYQLNYLNKIQETCPFLIVDPLTGTVMENQIPVKYGYADLYRFMGLNFISPFGHGHMPGVKFMKVPPSNRDYKPKLLPNPGAKYYAFQPRPLEENPFYQPVNYPIPDTNGNEILLKIKMNSPAELFKKIKDLHSSISTVYSTLPIGIGIGGKDTKTLTGRGTNQPSEYENITGKMTGGADKINVDITELFNLFDYLFKKLSDPNYILTDISGQERPMKKYFNSNFHNLLVQMLIAHGVYNFSKKTPLPDLEVGSEALDNYEKNKKVYEKYPELFNYKPKFLENKGKFKKTEFKKNF